MGNTTTSETRITSANIEPILQIIYVCLYLVLAGVFLQQMVSLLLTGTFDIIPASVWLLTATFVFITPQPFEGCK